MKLTRNSGRWISITTLVLTLADVARADDQNDKSKQPRAGEAVAPAKGSAAQVPPRSTTDPEQSDVDRKFYVVTGLLRLQEFESGVGLRPGSFKTPSQGLKIAVVQSVLINDGKISQSSGDPYYIIQVYPISAENDPLKGAPSFINSDDNTKVFAIRKSVFDAAVADEYISTRYRRGWRGFDAGPSLTLPFKLRPRVDDGDHHRNREITTDLSIGGYVAGRFRISETNPYFLNILVSAGVVILPISAQMSSDGMTGDSKATNAVPGLTAAFGLVTQLDKFQLGIMVGKDYASGAQGDSWIYSGRWWTSLAIGFNFFSRPDD